MSKLGTSGSLKECERDTASGGGAATLEETTLPLLFRAARWERTFTNTMRQQETSRRKGQSACSTFQHSGDGGVRLEP